MSHRPKRSDAIVQRLVVYDDLHVHRLRVQYPFDRLQPGPDVVGVEELERLHRLEVVHVFLRDLRNFQQPELVLIVNQCTTLYVGTRLIRHLHHEFNRFITLSVVAN
uniref:Uncharacterized protein n=1 Tax=Anopheles christyi TaxID=43041 RepID=A0A182KHV4_9DIPT